MANFVFQLIFYGFSSFFLDKKESAKWRTRQKDASRLHSSSLPAFLSSSPLAPSKDYLVFKLYGIFQEFPKREGSPTLEGLHVLFFAKN